MGTVPQYATINRNLRPSDQTTALAEIKGNEKVNKRFQGGNKAATQLGVTSTSNDRNQLIDAFVMSVIVKNSYSFVSYA
jgi:hypothetical protein